MPSLFQPAYVLLTILRMKLERYNPKVMRNKHLIFTTFAKGYTLETLRDLSNIIRVILIHSY